MWDELLPKVYPLLPPEYFTADAHGVLEPRHMYDIHINYMGCHTTPHCDNFNFDGPGDMIVNINVCGTGLLAFDIQEIETKDIYNEKKMKYFPPDERKFVNSEGVWLEPGDMTFFRGEKRYGQTHSIWRAVEPKKLKDMDMFKQGSNTKNQAFFDPSLRISVTLRFGEPTADGLEFYKQGQTI